MNSEQIELGIEELRQRIERKRRRHEPRSDLQYRMSRLRFQQLKSEIRPDDLGTHAAALIIVGAVLFASTIFYSSQIAAFVQGVPQ